MSDTPLQIRPATEADVSLVLGFIRELAEYEKLSHEVVATEETLRETLFGDAPAADVLLAHRDGAPAGFAVYFQTFSTFVGRPGVYLEDLYVKPEHRGRGIGKALLARVARIVRDRNGGRLEWAVLDWNQPAIDFYRSLGAVPMSDWTVNRITGDALRTLADRGH